MSDLTEIKRISDTTGATFSDAKNAYYAANGDFALAVNNISGGSYSGSTAGMAGDASSWFEKFLSSEFTVFTKPEKSISMPLILAGVIGLVCIEFIIPVLIVAFLVGVGYKFSGPLFRNDVVLQMKKSEDTPVNTERAKTYDYRAEFEKQEAIRKEKEAQRAQSVKYDMPPKYEYDYAYSYDPQDRGMNDRQPDEEKGFF